MSENTIDFLTSLKNYNKNTLTKQIWVPSLNKLVDFAALTAKHQKIIIKSTIDNPILNLTFSRGSYNIIKELCSDKALVDKFTVYDRDAILIQMRYLFIDETYKNISLEDHIKAFKLKINKHTPKIETVGNFRFVFDLPTIKVEQDIFNNYCPNKDLSLGTDDVEEVRTLISDLYYLEIIKHIVSVELIEEEISVEFREQTLEYKTAIVDYFDKDVRDAINKYINSVKKNYDYLYNLTPEIIIDVDPELFG